MASELYPQHGDPANEGGTETNEGIRWLVPPPPPGKVQMFLNIGRGTTLTPEVI
jgi:hypothetical protein